MYCIFSLPVLNKLVFLGFLTQVGIQRYTPLHSIRYVIELLKSVFSSLDVWKASVLNGIVDLDDLRKIEHLLIQTSDEWGKLLLGNGKQRWS